MMRCMDERVEDKLLGSDDDEYSRDLTLRVWNESKKFWRVAFPAIITRVTTFGIFVVTQSFMGHIGEVELASYALVQIILVRFANGILLGMASALETLCGQAFGARQYHMLGIYMQRSWIIVLATATILIPVFVFAGPIFRLLGEDEELSSEAGKIALWFIPILYYVAFFCTIQMYLQAQLKNAIIGWLSSISFAMHLILSWLFVYKLKLGVPGAMSAMIISTWSVTIGELVYVIGGWCPDTWKGFTGSAFLELFEVLKLSASSGVMYCLETWYNAVLVLLAGHLKNAKVSVAAFSICLNVVAWQLMIFFGFLTASCVRVSNELGRGDARAAKFSIKVIFATSVAIGMFFWSLPLAFGNVIPYAFSSSADVATVVSSLRVFLAFSFLLNSIQPTLTGVAIGAGWQAIVAYVNIACYYMIGVPIGILLAYVAHLKVKGVWIGMMCGIATQTCALIYMTWKTNWDAQVEKAMERLNRWFLPYSQEPEENTTHF